MKNLDKVDRRIERTRNAIINAFKEMIIDKEFKEITIKELAERANINRKTFYLHYESMEEILFDLTVELSDQIFESLNEKGFFEDNIYDINILIDCIEKILNTNYELTRKIVSANSYRFFSRNIKDIVKDSFKNKSDRLGYAYVEFEVTYKSEDKIKLAAYISKAYANTPEYSILAIKDVEKE
jgi:AcrR family transcriptional regulator